MINLFVVQLNFFLNKVAYEKVDPKLWRGYEPKTIAGSEHDGGESIGCLDAGHSSFFRYRMSCIGCSMALFETLQDVAHNYKIAPELFMLELLEVLPPAG